MLVFQKNWKHIEERCARAEVSFEWLLNIVAEINLYLPDDWRLTRSTNNFRIDVVADSHVVLVGSSFIGKGEGIIHIIDSVFPKNYFDNIDLQNTLMGKGKILVNKGV